MKIVLVGTGHVATVLLKKLHTAGHTIVQVYGRNHLAAAALANFCGADTCTNLAEVNQEAELYIIAVSDSALAGSDVHLALSNQLVVHTAGAVSMNVLKNMSAVYGVLYPFQTLRKEVPAPTHIPFMVDAINADALSRLTALAASIGQPVITANDKQRMRYHLCAVMNSNFSNYLYMLTENYCSRHGLDFRLLLPLIEETVQRLQTFSAAQVQTGPAIRKDLHTIEQHMALLQDSPELKSLYTTFTEAILHYCW